MCTYSLKFNTPKVATQRFRDLNKAYFTRMLSEHTIYEFYPLGRMVWSPSLNLSRLREESTFAYESRMITDIIHRLRKDIFVNLSKEA